SRARECLGILPTDPMLLGLRPASMPCCVREPAQIFDPVAQRFGCVRVLDSPRQQKQLILAPFAAIESTDQPLDDNANLFPVLCSARGRELAGLLGQARPDALPRDRG